jgi:hypothetical protein
VNGYKCDTVTDGAAVAHLEARLADAFDAAHEAETMKYRVSFQLQITQETFLDFDTEEEAQQFAGQWREEQDRFLTRSSSDATCKITVINEDRRMPFDSSYPGRSKSRFRPFFYFTSRWRKFNQPD